MIKRRLFRAFLLSNLFLSFFCIKQGYAQLDPNIPKIISPSPNAASLGEYGQIPVSLFNGLPQISIPLGKVTAGDLAIPISLNYHGGGIRPDQHSSWVGLGWALNAGGVITRRIIGVADERLVDISLSNPINRSSYYDRYAVADNNNWASVDTLINYFNYEDIMGVPAYPSPDEFVFNFGEYSGSFYLDHKGKWQVKSTAPVNLKIEEELQNDFILSKQETGAADITIKRIFYKFIIVTPDGNKYIFGGTPQSIEFTRSGDEGRAEYPDPYNSRIVPVSWYLTQIISNKRQQIDFVYERDGIQAILSSQILKYSWYGVGSTSVSLNRPVPTIINPSYLSEISAPNQRVKFYKSGSTELKYPYGNYLIPASSYSDLSTNETEREVEEATKWFKLDSISFHSNLNTYLSKVSFSYKQQTNTRLILDSLVEVGAGGARKRPYEFTYNNTPLPTYNSRMLDHWGFYNGRDFFLTHSTSVTDTSLVDAYTKSRNSDATYTIAGALTAIKYPTGGRSEFTYESHTFSKVAKRYPFIVSDTTGSCGGIRIRSIVNKDGFGNVLGSKDYLYVRNYPFGNNVSSGILAGSPQYLDVGVASGAEDTYPYWFWYGFSIEPLSFTEGNHVTYSEVVEKSADGSYTVYKYSNHEDNAYRDELPIPPGFYNSAHRYQLDPNTSRSLERGKLLLKSVFNKDNGLLQRTRFDYDTSALRYAEAVRVISLSDRLFGYLGHTIKEVRATPYLIYTFPRFLIKESDTLWDQSGNNPVVIIRHHRYNNYRLKSVDSTTNSLNQIVKNDYRYPFDMLPGSDPTGVYQRMVDSNVIEPVIEQKNFVNNIQQQYWKTTYYTPYTGIFVPQIIDVQNKINPIETRLRFFNYDTKGNVLSVSKDKDFPTSYLWNYKQSYPIAEVKNANLIDIAYTSFESDSTGNWNNYVGAIVTATTIMTPPSGRKYYTLSPANTLVKASLTSQKSYMVSYWKYGSGALNITGTVAGFPVSGRNFNGWFYYEHKITGQTTITISGTAFLDEVRLYPVDALMTSYTYDPMIGTTSIIDATSRITYYEYDEFQRLLLVRDQDRNIIKKIEYKYADPTLFYSVFKSKSFTRTNCAGCLIGGAVPYVALDSAYSSVFSQADADQKAQDYIDANGQAYANNVGTCTTPSPVPLSAWNYTSEKIYLLIRNNCTGVSSSFELNPNTINVALSPLPGGDYSVSQDNNGGNDYQFRVNNQISIIIQREVWISDLPVIRLL